MTISGTGNSGVPPRAYGQLKAWKIGLTSVEEYKFCFNRIGLTFLIYFDKNLWIMACFMMSVGVNV
jgi:hypothetical protein